MVDISTKSKQDVTGLVYDIIAMVTLAPRCPMPTPCAPQSRVSSLVPKVTLLKYKGTGQRHIADPCGHSRKQPREDMGYLSGRAGAPRVPSAAVLAMEGLF